MAKFYDRLDDRLKAFIKAQKIFFTATAAASGRINLSPKGLDSFRVIDDHTVCYVNLTGSGNETAAHLLADGRLTVMFCSFDEKPLILRLYGRGRAVHPRDEEWTALSVGFPDYIGARQIIVLKINSVQTSCGYSVPFFEFKGERTQLTDWSEKKGEAGLREWWEKHNRVSLDGLPTGIFE